LSDTGLRPAKKRSFGSRTGRLEKLLQLASFPAPARKRGKLTDFLEIVPAYPSKVAEAV